MTDDKGQIIITGLSSDTLVVKETKAPDGYLLDDTPHGVFCQGELGSFRLLLVCLLRRYEMLPERGAINRCRNDSK